VIEVEADHLGSSPRRPAALGGARRAIEDLEEAHEPAGGASARQFFLPAADGAEVRARARAILEQPRLALGEIIDAHQVVLDRLDEAGRALRTLVSVLRFTHVVRGRRPRPVAPRALDAVLVIETAIEP